MTKPTKHTSGGGRNGRTSSAGISLHYEDGKRRRAAYNELIEYSRKHGRADGAADAASRREGYAAGKEGGAYAGRRGSPAYSGEAYPEEPRRTTSTRKKKKRTSPIKKLLRSLSGSRSGARRADNAGYHTTGTRRKKKAGLSLSRFFSSLGKSIGRGVYTAYTFLVGLPPKTLLVGGGSFGLLLILIIVLAVALPKGDGENQSLQTSDPRVALASDLSGRDGTGAGEQMDSGTVDVYGNAAGGLDAAEALPEDASQGEGDAAGTDSGFAGELKSGDDDPLISTAQVRLMELGYMDQDEPTQHFGPLTKSALTTFQRHNGLDDDGILGEGTYAALMSEEAKIYVMQLGDSGDDVEGVQQRLYELGYLDNKANITATFGEKTEAAAKTFQKKNKLTSDGKVGIKTISLLYEEDVVSNAFSLGDENAIIKDCQQKLRELGYITFKPDGVMGKSTVTGIKAFQRANGLTVDGALGPATRDTILSGDAQAMVLQLGDYGTDVKNMQSYLVKLKYLKSANATGYFGAITEDAVKYFQKRNSLSQDGKVGGVTLSIMKSTKAKAASSSYLNNQSKENASGGSSSGSSGSSSSGSGSSGSGSSVTVSGTGVTKMINLAKSKIGCKYVRGAKGPSTFDCSGFVYWCMKNAGISVSYMTSSMWRDCGRYTKISSMDSLQAGDILVFSGHVGIYIGGGSMIDASSSEGQVRKSSTVLKSGGYWTKNFLMAYRVF